MNRKLSVLVGMFLVALTAVSVGAVTNIFYDTEVRGFLNMSNVTQYLIVTNLTGCDTIDTDVYGRLTCGVDSGAGAAGEPHWVDGGVYLYPNTSYADNVAITKGYLNSTDWSNASSALNSTGILWANYSLYSSWANLLGVPAQISGNYSNLSFYSYWTNLLSVPAHISGNYTNLAYGLPAGNVSNLSYYSDYNNLLNVPSRFAGNYTNLSFYSYWNNLLGTPSAISNNYTNLSYYSYWTNLLSVPAHITGNYTSNSYGLEGTDWGTLTNGYYCTYDSVGTEVDCSTQYPVASSDSTWTLHNSYPAACSAGSAVTTIGDTSTCSAFQTGSEQSNTTEEMQDAVGGGYSNYSVGVDVQYDDTNNQFSATFDCSEVTDSAGDHLGCSNEDVTVDDDFLLNTGDTSTGNLTFSDHKGINWATTGTIYSNTTCTIIKGSTATLEIC